MSNLPLDRHLWINNVKEFVKIVGDSPGCWQQMISKKVSCYFTSGSGKIIATTKSCNSIKKICVFFENSQSSIWFEIHEFLHKFDYFEPSINIKIIEATLNKETQQRQEHQKFIERQEYQRIQEEEKRKQELQRRLFVQQQQEERKRQEKIARQKKRQDTINNMKQCFVNDFLNINYFYNTECSQYISEQKYHEEKSQYVQSWVNKNLGNTPDLEQTRAISEVNNHVQLIARAGSGKTTTLVNRALFLQKHCGILPSELLLLAFNKKAAKEIEERLSQKLHQNIPHVMTFHALAYALVHPEEELLYDQSDGSKNKSRALQSVINDHLRDPLYYDQIRSLMMQKFRSDWERITKGGFDKSPREMLEYRRSLPREGLDGNYYKSFGEKVIANFFFEHDIKYRYERNFNWDGMNYRPDFTILTGKNQGIVIEYFGLEGDSDYDEMSDKKRQFWSNQDNYLFIECNPKHFKYGETAFCASLKKCLEDLGIICQKLSEEKIWLKIKDRAIDNFTKSMVQFIQRCRQLSLTSDDLEYKIYNYNCDNEIERQFLELGQRFYQTYLERLKATGEEDFYGLMQRSKQLVTAGKTIFKRKSGTGNLKHLKYIFIDEYQDFSELFYNLIQAIREHNPRALFFCVGDDWQAINGFAGSDLHFFEKFKHYFPDSKSLHLSTNYRSKTSIVNLGNKLMIGLGKPALANKQDPGIVRLVDLNKFDPSTREREEYAEDYIIPILLRLVSRIIKNNKNVVLLSRTNRLPWYLNGKSQLEDLLQLISSHFPQHLRQKITISTAHKYKGLEKQVVIVLDAIARRYPLIHPDWIFTKIFGNSPEKIILEERRLFYVALTRAVDELFIITDNNEASSFLEKLSLSDNFNWSDYPPLVKENTQRITVSVGNQTGKGSSPTIQIKDLLKADSYKWNSLKKAWCRTYSAQNFSVQNFFSQSLWCRHADGVEVKFYNDLQEETAIYHVNSGNYKKLGS